MTPPRSPVPFLDSGAQDLLNEARTTFQRLALDRTLVMENGSELGVFLWKGDWIQDTVALMLRTQGIDAFNTGLFMSVQGVSAEALPKIFRELAGTPPTESEIMEHVVN